MFNPTLAGLAVVSFYAGLRFLPSQVLCRICCLSLESLDNSLWGKLCPSERRETLLL